MNNEIVSDLFDVIMEYENIIKMSESIEKEDIFNKYLRKFCIKDYDFRSLSASWFYSVEFKH